MLLLQQLQRPNIAGIDSANGTVVRLFHPRIDRWEDHFRWRGPLAIGRTAVGRVTITVLEINHPDAVTVRESLIAEGIFDDA